MPGIVCVESAIKRIFTRDSVFQVQEAHARAVQDLHGQSIEHERAFMQLRKGADDLLTRSSVAEAAAAHWQQRYEAVNGMLQAEQKQRHREDEAKELEW